MINSGTLVQNLQRPTLDILDTTATLRPEGTQGEAGCEQQGHISLIPRLTQRSCYIQTTNPVALSPRGNYTD
jgi:hypothetical protein